MPCNVMTISHSDTHLLDKGITNDKKKTYTLFATCIYTFKKVHFAKYFVKYLILISLSI